MHDAHEFLSALATVLGVAAVTTVVFQRLRQPVVLGYLIAGLIGSVVGGFLAQQLKIKLNLGNAFLEQVIIAILGAIVVLIIARIIT